VPRRQSRRVARVLAICVGVVSSGLPAAGLAEAQATGAPDPSYYLIEYTDIGPASTSTAAIEAGMTGAAWVELREIDRPADADASGCTIDTCPVVGDNYYGFSPTTSDIFDSPGVLIDESGHPWTWRIAFSLSQAQYEAAEAFVANVKLPNYGLYQSNATYDTGFPTTFGDTTWAHTFIGGPQTNCTGFVQAVQDAAGVRDAGRPWPIEAPDWSTQNSAGRAIGSGQIGSNADTGLSDPGALYSFLSQSGNGAHVASTPPAVIRSNSEPLDYSTPTDPPDACSVINLEQAVLNDPQAVAASLGLAFTDDQASSPDYLTKGGGPTPGPAPYYGYPEQMVNNAQVSNGTFDRWYEQHFAQFLEFADYGNGTNSIGNLSPYDTDCKNPTTGQIISCSGHGYSGPGPFKVRFFILGYGAALGEFDATWEYDPNSQSPGWVTDYTPSSSAEDFCSAPATLSAGTLQPARVLSPDRKRSSKQSSSYNACKKPSIKFKVTPIMEYFPRPHLSTQYFTATVNINPAQVPYRLDIYISNRSTPLSVANPISTYALALGAGLGQATQTSPQAWCFGQPTYVPVVKTNSSVVSVPSVQCRKFGPVAVIGPYDELNPITPGPSGAIKVALEVPPHGSQGAFVFAVDGRTASTRPSSGRAQPNYNLSSATCNAAIAARNKAINQWLSLLNKLPDFQELASKVLEAAKSLDTVGAPEAFGELFVELAKGTIKGGAVGLGVITATEATRTELESWLHTHGCGPGTG
jgi:hypothetical protein